MSGLLQIHEPGQTPAPHADQETLAVGIDLGTTQSAIAYAKNQKATLLPIENGHVLTPSMVSYATAHEVVGGKAKAQIPLSPDHVVRSIKRHMGTAKTFHKKTPEEISGHILRHLKEKAEALLDHPLQKAVITVPAYFSEGARMATRHAAQLAGFHVLRLLNEPTAAALAYGLDQGKEGLYLVYDLGGGTFDVTLLNLKGGIFQVLATGGDTHLGGDDVDQALARFLYGKEEVQDSRLLEKAREIKESLSKNPGSTWEGEGLHVSQEGFKRILEPFLEKTLSICEDVLREGNAEETPLNDVILVGGSSQIPAISQVLEQRFQKTPLCSLDPTHVVAMGAALQAEALTSGASHLLLDVTPLSLGIETMGGLIEKIIPRNTPIPCAIAQEFTTSQEGQTALSIHILQGERETVDHCRSLGKFNLKDIPPMPAGMARVQVTFTLDADGLLSVQAKEKTTGVHQNLHVQQSQGLDEEKVLALLRESYEKAEEDMEDRLLRSARVEGEQLVYVVEQALEIDGTLLTEEERTSIENHKTQLRDLIKTTDRESIETATKNLSESTQDFAERRISKAIKDTLKGTKPDLQKTRS